MAHQLRTFLLVVAVLLWQGNVRRFVAVEFGVEVGSGNVHKADLETCQKPSFVERLIHPLPYKALDGAKTTVQNFISS